MSTLVFTKLNSRFFFSFYPTIRFYEVDLLSFVEDQFWVDINQKNRWKPKTSEQSGSISRWFCRPMRLWTSWGYAQLMSLWFTRTPALFRATCHIFSCGIYLSCGLIKGIVLHLQPAWRHAPMSHRRAIFCN